MTTTTIEADARLFTTPAARTAYAELIGEMREIAVLRSTLSLLAWDQEAKMPRGGVEHRAGQIGMLAKMVHQRSTARELGEKLAVCEGDGGLAADPHSVAATNVREARRRYDRQTKLPTELVQEMTLTASKAKAEWKEARKAADFSRFAPWLAKVTELNRRQAECFGFPADGEPWDALADGFEPGCTAREVEGVFKPLRDRLVALLDRVMGRPGPSDAFHRLELPIDKQREFVRFVVARYGFDFDRGRLDESTHPFCSGIHVDDVRMTTRFRIDNFADALSSTCHESGHGIYNQGLPREHWGTPAGSPISLGIHESQSRMWENQVGRSAAFWRWAHPELKRHFGAPVAAFSEADVYGACNRVEPSFIRVEADELTYNLHIMVRFEIERALIRGDLDSNDVPVAWNTKYREYLGVEVPDDAQGCLQDIHWSQGAMGYFPTYTLGNLYAAQLFDTARAELGDVDAQFAVGNFAPLKAWLNEKVHAPGMRYRAAELCEKVTGAPLSADPLLTYLEGKLAPLYRL
jgi:carboxypeptidase Taq